MATDTSALKFSVPFIDPNTGVLARWAYNYLLNPSITTLNAHSINLGIPLRPPSGGLGISSGNSGGILGFTAATTIASSSALGANQIVLGGGAGATPATPVGLGTATTLLHGNATGGPSWAAVSLTADVSGVLPVANGGTNASAAGATAANNIGALAIASNLSDVANAGTSRTNLGLGTMAVENSTAVSITGGSIDGTTVGSGTPAAGKFTTIVGTTGMDSTIIGASTPAAITATTLTSTAGRADTSYSYQTPATGFTITIGNGVYTLILDPAGALLTGTITMPSAPGDGQVVRMTSTQNISALTVSPNTGQSIKNAPTAFTVSLTGDQGYEFIYRAANTTWYRLQ